MNVAIIGRRIFAIKTSELLFSGWSKFGLTPGGGGIAPTVSGLVVGVKCMSALLTHQSIVKIL